MRLFTSIILFGALIVIYMVQESTQIISWPSPQSQQNDTYKTVEDYKKPHFSYKLLDFLRFSKRFRNYGVVKLTGVQQKSEDQSETFLYSFVAQPCKQEGDGPLCPVLLDTAPYSPCVATISVPKNDESSMTKLVCYIEH